MIPPRVRVFSVSTITEVSGCSRTKLWRRNWRGRMGADVLELIQKDRAENGVSPLSAEMQEEVLAALAAVEDAKLARNTERRAA